MDLVDVHHPEAGAYRMTTRDGRPGQPRVDTFADIAATYQNHPEVKSLGSDRLSCRRATVGLLQRRPIVVGVIRLIGKESNRMEERAAGELTIDDLDLRLTTYEDHDEWYRVVLPELRRLGVRACAAATGMSERRARDVLAGRAIPHAFHRSAFVHLMEVSIARHRGPEESKSPLARSTIVTSDPTNRSHTSSHDPGPPPGLGTGLLANTSPSGPIFESNVAFGSLIHVIQSLRDESSERQKALDELDSSPYFLHMQSDPLSATLWSRSNS